MNKDKRKKKKKIFHYHKSFYYLLPRVFLLFFVFIQLKIDYSQYKIADQEFSVMTMIYGRYQMVAEIEEL